MIHKKIIKEKKNIHLRPNFVEITKEILTQTQYSDIISWNVDGDKILLKNRQQFEQIVLPKFFKHKNYASYLRQLNFYGFTCQKHEQGILEFQNINFTEKKQDNIQRKSVTIYKELKNELQQNHDNLKLQLFQMKDLQQKIESQFKQNILVNTQIRRIIYKITDNLRVLKQFREKTIVKLYKILKTFIQGMVSDSQYLYCQLIVYVIKDVEFMFSLMDIEMLQQYQFPLPNEQLQGQITSYLEKKQNTMNPADFSFFEDINDDSFSNQLKL